MELVRKEQRIRIYGIERDVLLHAIRKEIEKPEDIGERVYHFQTKGSYFIQGSEIYFKNTDFWSISTKCLIHPCYGQLLFPDDSRVPSVCYFLRARYMAGRACYFVPGMCSEYRESKVKRGGGETIAGKFMLRQPRKHVVVDLEYNRGKIPDWKPKPLSMDYISSKKIDTKLYDLFCKYMNKTFAESPYKIREHSGHMTVPIDVGSMFDAENRCLPYILKSTKFDGRPFVTTFPKLQNFTSDGRMRTVFPASSGLQRFLEDEIGCRLPNIEPHQYVKGPYFHKYISSFQSYDVKTADKTLWPYYMKWVKEFFAEYEEYLIPICIQCLGDAKWNIGHLTQFPSGLYGLTSVVGTCFTAAICDLLNIEKAFIQGDGFVYDLMQPPVEHAYIRRDKDNTVNGFFYDETFHYVNGPKKLRSLRAYTPKKMNGNVRWEFRREIYRRLNATNLPPSRVTALAAQFQAMSNSLLMQCARDNDELFPGFRFCSNNVDLLPHTLVECPVLV